MPKNHIQDFSLFSIKYTMYSTKQYSVGWTKNILSVSTGEGSEHPPPKKGLVSMTGNYVWLWSLNSGTLKSLECVCEYYYFQVHSDLDL